MVLQHFCACTHKRCLIEMCKQVAARAKLRLGEDAELLRETCLPRLSSLVRVAGQEPDLLRAAARAVACIVYRSGAACGKAVSLGIPEALLQYVCACTLEGGALRLSEAALPRRDICGELLASFEPCCPTSAAEMEAASSPRGRSEKKRARAGAAPMSWLEAINSTVIALRCLAPNSDAAASMLAHPDLLSKLVCCVGCVHPKLPQSACKLLYRLAMAGSGAETAAVAANAGPAVLAALELPGTSLVSVAASLAGVLATREVATNHAVIAEPMLLVFLLTALRAHAGNQAFAAQIMTALNAMVSTSAAAQGCLAKAGIFADIVVPFMMNRRLGLVEPALILATFLCNRNGSNSLTMLATPGFTGSLSLALTAEPRVQVVACRLLRVACEAMCLEKCVPRHIMSAIRALRVTALFAHENAQCREDAFIMCISVAMCNRDSAKHWLTETPCFMPLADAVCQHQHHSDNAVSASLALLHIIITCGDPYVNTALTHRKDLKHALLILSHNEVARTPAQYLAAQNLSVLHPGLVHAAVRAPLDAAAVMRHATACSPAPEECAICLAKDVFGCERASSGEPTCQWLQLPCKHHFHTACVAKWFTVRHTAKCPCCRRNILSTLRLDTTS